MLTATPAMYPQHYLKGMLMNNFFWVEFFAVSVLHFVLMITDEVSTTSQLGPSIQTPLAAIVFPLFLPPHLQPTHLHQEFPQLLDSRSLPHLPEQLIQTSTLQSDGVLQGTLIMHLTMEVQCHQGKIN